MAEEQTPYAEAIALRDAGHKSEAIAARLSGRGLDAEAVALLLNAVGVRASDLPLPRVEASSEAVVVKGTSTHEPPVLICPRCGVFLKVDSFELVLGKAYCLACAARPDVNYPRAYREAHWGKRDGWAWFIGFLSLISLLSGAFTLTVRPLLGITLILSGVGYLVFWSGAKVGRPALVAVTGLGMVLNVAQGLPPNLLGLLFVVLAMSNTRSKLFFELEVPEAELATAWMAQHDNRPAQFARALGFIALATTLTWMGSWKFACATIALGLLAVMLGIIGVRRVKPDAVPPVGRRSAAITGIVAGALATVAGAVCVVLYAIVWA